MNNMNFIEKSKQRKVSTRPKQTSEKEFLVITQQSPESYKEGGKNDIHHGQNLTTRAANTTSTTTEKA